MIACVVRVVTRVGWCCALLFAVGGCYVLCDVSCRWVMLFVACCLSLSVAVDVCRCVLLLLLVFCVLFVVGMCCLLVMKLFVVVWCCCVCFFLLLMCVGVVC